MRLALYGFMGAGKSALGKALARRLGYSFIDLDEAIEQNTGQNIAQIFKEKGEIGFRKIEHQTLKDFIKKNLDNVVLSLGGGTIIQPTNRQLLALRQYKKIYLNVAVPVLIERLKKEKNKRPLIQTIPEQDLAAYINALFLSRQAVYEQNADLKINIAQENFDQALEKLYLHLNLN